MKIIGSASCSSIFVCFVGDPVVFTRFAGLSDEGVFGDLRFFDAVLDEGIFGATFFGAAVLFFFALIFVSFGSSFIPDTPKRSSLAWAVLLRVETILRLFLLLSASETSRVKVQVV